MLAGSLPGPAWIAIGLADLALQPEFRLQRATPGRFDLVLEAAPVWRDHAPLSALGSGEPRPNIWIFPGVTLETLLFLLIASFLCPGSWEGGTLALDRAGAGKNAH